MDCDIILYGIKNCSTVRKAMQWLNVHGVSYSFHDFKKDGLDKKTLTSWVHAVGWTRILNRSGMTFRKLPEENKILLDEGKTVALMLAYPTLIRRPVLTGKDVHIGFNPDVYETIFAFDAEDN